MRCARLHRFPDHPYKVEDNEEMEALAESIREYGILNPLLVRRVEGSETDYELISGHRRAYAAAKAGLETVPAFVVSLDRNEAAIALVDSNLHRERLLPSEKAFAYKMKYEALKHQGASSQVGTKLRTDEQIAKESGESRNQIHRYIRLNRLIPALQDAVEDKKIAFNPAVEISYLDPADQAIVQEVMEREETAPSLSQAQKLKKMAQDGSITDKRIDEVLTVEKPMYETITFRFNTIEKFFPAGTTGKQMEQKIYEWMERYRQQWQSREEKAQEQER